MKFPRSPHRWNVSPKRAIAIQHELAPLISTARCNAKFNLVAGADINFTRDGRHAVAAVVVWDVQAALVVETRTATRPVRFPYVPGLLSFREAPVLLAAIKRLNHTPDAFLFDGQGYAHPRRFGLACHMGLILNCPSAGCGKSRLIGDYVEPAMRRGSRRALTHDGERIGAVVRTRTDVKYVYVSVGHRMSLDQSVDLVLSCSVGFRLPEPTRLADRLVAGIKRRSSR